MADVVLKFISGPLQGHEFPLETGQDVILGRSEDADLRIVEDSVSRKHARIYFRNDEFVIEDLSKNGTYVNSRQIQKAVLMPGDLIYIGQSVLKVAAAKPSFAPMPVMAGMQASSAPVEAQTHVALATFRNGETCTTLSFTPPNQTTAPGTSTGEHFRGTIGDIALSDLLQLLSSARKTGILVLRWGDMLGKIFLNKGQITYATMDEVTPVNPRKVLYRLMRWTEGTFEFAPPGEAKIPASIAGTTDHLLLEAMHELDEINNLGPDLPSLHTEVELANPLPAPLKDLAPGDLDFLQLAMRHKMVRDILDHFSGTDFQGYTYLKSLIGRRFLVVTL